MNVEIVMQKYSGFHMKIFQNRATAVVSVKMLLFEISKLFSSDFLEIWVLSWNSILVAFWGQKLLISESNIFNNAFTFQITKMIIYFMTGKNDKFPFNNTTFPLFFSVKAEYFFDNWQWNMNVVKRIHFFLTSLKQSHL